ncbi:TIGR04222 domain-containing membrane protein [Streptomyces sp. NPDC001777]|uniref:TIGR04222 domain-containing membrane protein n=1 Tax=Streptomyces sp. NPDC001777 TaxID=3364608 RepID=UPI003682DBF9
MSVVAGLLDISVMLSSVLLIAGLARARRGPGGPVHDLHEVAFLNGGPGRVADTVLTAMHTDGRIAVGGPGIVAVRRAEAHDPVERAVLQEHAAGSSGALHTLREAVMRHPAVQEIGDGLAARGLLAPPAAGRTWRRWGIAQGLFCLLAVPVSIAVTVSQYTSADPAAESPEPFVLKVLLVLLVGALVGFVCARVARRRVTGAGRRAAAAYTTALTQDPCPAHLVATRGLRYLPDADFHAQLVAAARMRPAGGRPAGRVPSSSQDSSALLLAPVVWCAGAEPGHGSCGSSGDGNGGGGGGSCSSGSGCGSGSGSSCGGSGGSSCSSGGSSCGGSSCGGGS